MEDTLSVEYKDSKYSVLNGCDSLILLTEWLVEDFVVWSGLRPCSTMQPYLLAYAT